MPILSLFPGGGSSGNVPIASSERAGVVRVGSDFDIAEDGTLSLYTPLTLSASVSPSSAEKGGTVDKVTLSWRTNKTAVSVSVDGQAIDPTTSQVAFDSQNITSNKTYTVIASDTRREVAATAQIKFYNGVYYGEKPAPQELDSAFIQTLPKTLRGDAKMTFFVDAPSGAYIWYACPVRYGTPNFNVGGFDGGFSLAATFDFTNPSGYTESYQVWRSDNTGLGKTTVKVS